MVYGHLLQQDGLGPGHFNGHQVDSYHTFTGPMDRSIKDPEYEQDAEPGPDKDTYRPFLPVSETFIPSRPRTPLGGLDSLKYEDRRMVDNVLYTFKTLGDPNQARHSAAESQPLPEPEPFNPEYDEAM